MGQSRGFWIGLILTVSLAGEIVCEGNSHSTAHAAVSDDTSVPVPPVAATPVHSTSSAAVHSDVSDNPGLSSILQTLQDNPSLAAAAASALGGGAPGGYNLPPPPGGPRPHFPYGGLGGLGGILPYLPLGFGKGFNLNVDAGAGGYFPIVEKIIVVVGGGILILLLLAFIQGSLAAGGFLSNLFGSFSKAIAGSASVNVGPIHDSVAGAASVSANNGINVGGGNPNDPNFNRRVFNGINQPPMPNQPPRF